MENRNIQKEINKIFNKIVKKGWNVDIVNKKIVGDIPAYFFGKAIEVIRVIREIQEELKKDMTHLSYDEFLKLAEDEKINEDIAYYYYKENQELIEEIEEKIRKKELKNTDVIFIRQEDDDETLYLVDILETFEEIKDEFETQKHYNEIDD